MCIDARTSLKVTGNMLQPLHERCWIECREKTYDGLYRITRAWKERGKDSFIICRQVQGLPSCQAALDHALQLLNEFPRSDLMQPMYLQQTCLGRTWYSAMWTQEYTTAFSTSDLYDYISYRERVCTGSAWCPSQATATSARSCWPRLSTPPAGSGMTPNSRCLL